MRSPKCFFLFVSDNYIFELSVGDARIGDYSILPRLARAGCSMFSWNCPTRVSGTISDLAGRLLLTIEVKITNEATNIVGMAHLHFLQSCHVEWPTRWLDMVMCCLC